MSKDRTTILVTDLVFLVAINAVLWLGPFIAIVIGSGK